MVPGQELLKYQSDHVRRPGLPGCYIAHIVRTRPVSCGSIGRSVHGQASSKTRVRQARLCPYCPIQEQQSGVPASARQATMFVALPVHLSGLDVDIPCSPLIGLGSLLITVLASSLTQAPVTKVNSNEVLVHTGPGRALYLCPDLGSRGWCLSILDQPLLCRLTGLLSLNAELVSVRKPALDRRSRQPRNRDVNSCTHQFHGQ